MGMGKKKPYSGNFPKCHFHHNGPYTQKCHKCNKVGHFARDYRSYGNTNVANTQKGNGENPKGNGCFECGAPGHFKRDWPKLKNKDGGNDEDEREPMFIQPHDLDYVSEPMYPEYIPLKDEHVLPAKEQPLPLVVSPTTESPKYVAESDPEEDLEEYEDDESEDGLEEEEHLASIDFAFVVPGIELVSPPEGTEPVIPPPSTDIATTGARIIVRLQASISLPLEAKVERLLAMPTPPPSPLTSLSPPSVRERLARDTWVNLKEAVPEIAPMTLGETEMAEFRETGRRRQAQMVEILRVMGDMRRDMGGMQAELLALRE
nr:hypothetical protein [Tanacetum cinerariifolium]